MTELITVVLDNQTITVSTRQESDGWWYAYLPDDSDTVGQGETQINAICDLLTQTEPK